MYARLNSGAVAQYPFYINTLKAEHPNTSFPNNIEVDYATLAEFNVVRVFDTQKPEVNKMTHKVVEGTPAEVEGRWEQVWEVVELSPEEIQTQTEILKSTIVSRVQERLDAFAQTRNYDSILSACTYATSTINKFAIEGQYCVIIRDQTWSTLYSVINEIEQGIRPVPGSYEEIEPELPALVWPN